MRKNNIDKERYERLMKKMLNNDNDLDYLSRPTKEFDEIDKMVDMMKRKSRYGMGGSGSSGSMGNSGTSGSMGGSGSSGSNELDEFLGTGKYSTHSTTISHKRRRSNKKTNKPPKVNKGDFNWDKDKEREKETKDFFAFHDKKFKEFIKKQFN